MNASAASSAVVELEPVVTLGSASLSTTSPLSTLSRQAVSIGSIHQR